MPNYDYRCDHCGNAFTAAGGFNDPSLAACPRCGKRPHRVISATAIVFKGSGWYKTDSRPAPSEGSDAPPAAGAADGAAAADKTAADKPAADKPAAEKPAARKPAAGKPAAEGKPAAADSADRPRRGAAEPKAAAAKSEPTSSS